MTLALSYVAMLAGIGLVAAYCRDLGFKAGYKQGRKDESDWWIGAESEADQARQKIWREERRVK